MAFEMAVAAVQMTSTGDKEANVTRAESLVRQAASNGATLIVLPELFNCLADFACVLANAEPIPGETSQRMSSLARELRVFLCAGSIGEVADGGRGFNTSLFFAPSGAILAKYRKIHLFDIQLPGQVELRESSAMLPGDEVISCTAQGATLGFATCYDLRFPELFRALVDQGVQIVCFPSAFTRATGQAHWHVLLRARAIENQCYVIAANQVGRHAPKLESFGHTLIVDPWGKILAEADEDCESMVTATINSHDLVKMRESLPSLSHRKQFWATNRADL